MKLLEQVRQQIRLQHLALSTERSYLAWIAQFIRFYKTPTAWQHPKDLLASHVEAFLTHLAVHRRVAASTQNQALSAILFLYRDVLKIDLGDFSAVRAHRTRHVPVVLSDSAVADLLAAINVVRGQGGGHLARGAAPAGSEGALAIPHGRRTPQIGEVLSRIRGR